jgi:gluconokinase
LTGKKYTEPGIASSSQLMNINTFDWDPDILNFAGISKDQLPQIASGEYVVDTLSKEMAELLNLNPGIPIIPGFYDGGSLIIGMGGINPDTGVCNIGTTGMLRSCSREILMDALDKQRIQTYGLIHDIWAIGGAVNNAGIALEWVRNHISGNDDFKELNRQADKIAPGADGLFCLPFLTGERDPRIGNMASGSFFGLKEYHRSGHLARSVMEGVGYALNLIKGAIEDNGVKYKNLMIGGAGSKSDVWTQILANIFNTPLQRSLTTEPTLVGSAILAFKSLGMYENLESASNSMVKTGDVFEPDFEVVKTYQENYQFFLKLLKSNQRLYQEHSQLF